MPTKNILTHIIFAKCISSIKTKHLRLLLAFHRKSLKKEKVTVTSSNLLALKPRN